MRNAPFLALQAKTKERLALTRADLAACLRLMRLADALGYVAAALGTPTPARESPAWEGHAEAVKEACAQLAAALKEAERDTDEAFGDAARTAMRKARQEVAATHRGDAGSRTAPPSKAPGVSELAGVYAGGVRADTARFGASAPTSAAPGSQFVARFVAYGDGQREAAEALAQAAKPGMHAEFRAGGRTVERGTLIEVALSGKGLLVYGEPRSVQSFEWTGEPASLSFAVETKQEAEGDTTLLCFEVLVAGIVLSRMALPVCIASKLRPRLQQVDGCRLARKAFASYSSSDRQRVLDRVAAIRIAAGVDVFVDRAGLVPGEDWKNRLAAEIDGCDTFMLFWSQAAKSSRWVRWEWSRAIEKHGLQHLQFHPLVNGIKPPPQLKSVHLGDAYMDLMAVAATRARSARAAQRKGADT